MTDERLSPPDAARSRYVAWQWLIMAVFGVAVVAASIGLRHVDETWLRALLAALPLTVLGLWGWGYYRIVRDDDEMMRAFYFRVAAISGVLVVLGATMWGLLERLLGAPALDSFLLLPIFAAVHGIIGWIDMRRP